MSSLSRFTKALSKKAPGIEQRATLSSEQLQHQYESTIHGRVITNIWEDECMKEYVDKLDDEIGKYMDKPTPAKGIYTCNKCKSNLTSHYSLQVRSADEPMTVFITCLNCANKWKE